jgi:replication factor A1
MLSQKVLRPLLCCCWCCCLQAPIDVIGVVVSVGAIGSVKRKVDNSDLTRRDITLADSSRYSVVLTLWGDAALRTDFTEGSVLQVGGSDGR